MKNRKQVFYLHEQVGFCKASPEPFQLFQSHKVSRKSVYVWTSTLASIRIHIIIRSSEPVMPKIWSGTHLQARKPRNQDANGEEQFAIKRTRPNSTSPSCLHQHRVPQGRHRPRRQATVVTLSAARLEGGIKDLPPLPGPTCVQFLLMNLMLPNNNMLLAMLYRCGRGISVSSSDDVPI